jgi:hypothetical protein
MFEFYCSYCGSKSTLQVDSPPICQGEQSKYGAHASQEMRHYNREDRRNKKKHPIQPLEDDGNAVLRFKHNNIVRHLLDHGGLDLNKLAVLDFPREDWEQFAQLIGYSLSGFGDLSYVSNRVWNAAEKSSRYACRRMCNKYKKKKEKR